MPITIHFLFLNFAFSIQIFKDKDKHEALICDGCLEDLNEAILLREKMRNTEMFYFQKQVDGFSFSIKIFIVYCEI